MFQEIRDFFLNISTKFFKYLENVLNISKISGFIFMNITVKTQKKIASHLKWQHKFQSFCRTLATLHIL